MKTIKVGEHVFLALYAGISPFVNHFKTQIYSSGVDISYIAEVFDGNKGMEFDNGKNKKSFVGYSLLKEIRRVDAETVLVILDYSA